MAEGTSTPASSDQDPSAGEASTGTQRTWNFVSAVAEDEAAARGKEVGLDVTVAHNARVWNYWLGGRDNFAVDREVGEQVREVFPGIADVARADRAFLGRAVRYLAGDVGIRQFLDIGTGLPTADNTHEVAQRVAPESRIVYVDNDALVLVHARALLVGTAEGATDYISADAHDPAAILRAASRTLDFTKPTAIMMLGVLNFILDTDKAISVVKHLMDRVPSGSYLVVAHPTHELGGENNAASMRHWNERATPPLTARGHSDVARFFEGLELLEPGIVSCSRWRPEPTPSGVLPGEVPQFGTVARKP